MCIWKFEDMKRHYEVLTVVKIKKKLKLDPHTETTNSETNKVYLMIISVNITLVNCFQNYCLWCI